MNDLDRLFCDISKHWAPPPKWTVSQWADTTRKLSSEASAEPGQWRTSRAEYQREMLDAISDPLIQHVAIMSSAQVGKTEILLNTIGYYVDYDPCPILVLQPTLEMAEAFSKDRITPMFRDTPQLGSRLAIGKQRDQKDTILHKSFVGGHVTMAGANSPSSLASRPIRVVLADEVDRYPASAGEEGDPLKLASKRTSTFWNRKIIAVSTPTIKGASRIEAEFNLSDKRYYNIPCPRCSTPHVLKWENIVWKNHDPDTALCRCPHCDGYYTNAEKNAAVRKGRWIATAPFNGRAGFHIWEAYSPWKSIADIVRDWLEAKDDPAKRQVFENTSKGESWEGSGEKLDANDLLQRVEEYAAEVPSRALMLTAGVDTQPDRLECEVVGWGAGEESWSIDYQVFHGDPDIKEGDQGSPWTQLTDYLRRSRKHESGMDMPIRFTCIDSGGHNTQAVYDYAKAHKGDNIFAIKGIPGEDKPIVGSPNRKRSGKLKRKVDLYLVGVDSAKNRIMQSLKVESPGDPGYCHFPKSRDPDWFRQLTAEKLVTRYVKGFKRREWQKASGARNEALDCRVYALAALVMAGPQDWGKASFRIKKATVEKPLIIERPKPQPTAVEEEEPSPDVGPKKPKPNTPTRRARRGGFVQSWR